MIKENEADPEPSEVGHQSDDANFSPWQLPKKLSIPGILVHFIESDKRKREVR